MPASINESDDAPADPARVQAALQRLRGAALSGGGGGDKEAAAATVVLDNLDSFSQYAYFAELNFPGDQTLEVLVDTGSSELLVATTACDACQQVRFPPLPALAGAGPATDCLSHPPHTRS